MAVDQLSAVVFVICFVGALGVIVSHLWLRSKLPPDER
jgi:hypothetical protein